MLQMSRLYDDFESCQTVQETRSVATNALSSLGLFQFVYLCWSNDTLSVELSIHTYSSAWTDRYVVKGYERIDPVIGMALAQKDPFLWSAEDHQSDQATKTFFDEADEFGLFMGVTIPLKAIPSRRIFVTFAAPRSSDKFMRIRSDQRFLPTAKFLALSLHRTLSRLQNDHLVPLSIREREAMKMSATGLSSAEIAEALSLSKDTINEVLSRATRKLGQESRASACHMFRQS